SPLYRQVYGGGGGGGGGAAIPGGPVPDTAVSCPLAGMQLSRTSPLYLDPDAGPPGSPALSLSVIGTSSCGASAPSVASLCLTHEVGHNFNMCHDFSGVCADAESVIVKQGGVIVLRSAISSASTLTIAAPPGSSPLAGVVGIAPVTKSSSNIQNNLIVPGAENLTTG